MRLARHLGLQFFDLVVWGALVVLLLGPGQASAQMLGEHLGQVVPMGAGEGPRAIGQIYSQSTPVFRANLFGSGVLASVKADTGQAITCTNASTATCQTGPSTVVSAGTNTCCLGPDGLAVWPLRANLVVNSQSMIVASGWTLEDTVGGMTSNGNACTAPDGTNTGTSIHYPNVSGGQHSDMYQGVTGTVATYSWSMWLQNSSGPTTVYLSATPDGVTYYRTACTAGPAWSRCSVSGTESATTWFHIIGVDLRDSGQQFPQGPQTICTWGAQDELGPYPSDYAPTGGTPATHNATVVSIANPITVSGAGTIYSIAMTARLAGIGGTQVLFGSNQNFAPELTLSTGAGTNVLGSSDTVPTNSTLAYSDANKKLTTRYRLRKNGTSVIVSAAGVDGTNATAAAQPTEPTTLQLGQHNGANQLGGWLRSLCIDKTLGGCQ